MIYIYILLILLYLNINKIHLIWFIFYFIKNKLLHKFIKNTSHRKQPIKIIHVRHPGIS